MKKLIALALLIAALVSLPLGALADEFLISDTPETIVPDLPEVIVPDEPEIIVPDEVAPPETPGDDSGDIVIPPIGDPGTESPLEPEAEPTPEPTLAPKKKATIDPADVVIEDLEAGTLLERLTDLGATDAHYPGVLRFTVESGMLDQDDFKTIRRMTNLRELVLTGAELEGDELPEGALEDMVELRELRLPGPLLEDKSRSRITSIGARALKNCVKLEMMSALNHVGSVDDEAFYGCKALPYMLMSELHTIGERAFYDCAGFKSFDFSSVEYIGADAFNGCALLTEAVMPKAQYVGVGAFKGCAALTTVKFAKGYGVEIDDEAFAGNARIRTAVIGGASRVGERAFKGCNRLAEISLLSCEVLGDEAFAGCTRLEKVDWPKLGIGIIGDNCFNGCAIDLSRGYPSGVNARKAGVQKPRIYFSLSKTKGTVAVDEDWNAPKYHFRTRRGTDIESILGADWVSPDLAVPDISRTPRRADTSVAGKTTFTYFIPDHVFANTHEIEYVLTVVDEIEPTPEPTPRPTPRPETDDVVITEVIKAPEDDEPVWAVLDGLTLSEFEESIGRDVFDLELREELDDYAVQTVYPIDLDLIEPGAAISLPLVTGGYLVGDLVIDRQVDDPETDDVEEEGLIFGIEASEHAEIFEATLQIAQSPEQLDLLLARNLDEIPQAEEEDPDAAPRPRPEEEDTDPEHELCFYPLDELTDASGLALLYVNARTQFDTAKVEIHIPELERYEALLQITGYWVQLDADAVEDDQEAAD